MIPKVAIVTGGGQGIGKGIVKKLLTDGYFVFVAEIDESAGIETEKELLEIGKLKFIKTDVASESSVIEMVNKVIIRFGVIHTLINNAGISNPINKPVEELDLEEWNTVISTNLTGMFLCSKHCIPYLKKTKGTIINIASTRALQSEANTEAYSSSKGGVLALTHSLAISLSPSIRVNSISPGWIDVSKWQKSSMRKKENMRSIDHKQHPAGRVGIPEDIANMTSYLISPQAEFITGQNFIIDGGMTKKMIYED